MAAVEVEVVGVCEAAVLVWAAVVWEEESVLRRLAGGEVGSVVEVVICLDWNWLRVVVLGTIDERQRTEEREKTRRARNIGREGGKQSGFNGGEQSSNELEL